MSTKSPPTTGPAMKAALVHAVHAPIAFACATPRNADMMMASELGTRSAPAIPCNPRLTMRISTFGASAHRSEVMPNPHRPIRMTTTRP